MEKTTNLNWLAGFLNQQQYEGVPIIPRAPEPLQYFCLLLHVLDRAGIGHLAALISPYQRHDTTSHQARKKHQCHDAGYDGWKFHN